MAYCRALLFAGLLCLAVTAAGGTSVKNSGDVWAKQKQWQSSENDASYNSGPVNQQSSNQGIQQAGNGNDADNYSNQKIEGRRLLGGDYYVDNSGNVWAKQAQYQSSSNNADNNGGPVNQQSSNQAIQQAGNGNSASNGNKQTIKGRKLQGWYNIDNSGNVNAKQKQGQFSGNSASYNSGPVNQQSSNQAVQQAGNGNSAENYSNQKIKGRRLLGAGWYHVDNSGNVWAKQSQWQSSENDASYNSGPVNQQSQNQAVQQAGNGNEADNYSNQKISGRRLLGDDYYVDNSGNVWAKQAQYQSSSNEASGNSGPVNQQSQNQAIQQAGNGNSASNYNKQTIKGPDHPKGRKLQAWYNIDNSGNVNAKQKQGQWSGNSASYNSGPVNQQSSNQGIQQAGNGNAADNYNKQTIKGRKLQGHHYYVDNSGDVWAKQSQYQSSSNEADNNGGPVNQQSSNQAIQQAGNGNSAFNGNKQTIKP